MSDSLMQDAKTVIYGQHQPELLDLVVLGPDRKPLKRVAIAAALSVGQSNGDLKVEDSRLASPHFSIVQNQTGHVLKPNSANDSVFKRVQKSELREGDEIRIGGRVIRVRRKS